jgi:hypothetical protein
MVIVKSIRRRPAVCKESSMYGKRDLELIHEHRERLLREADRWRLVGYLRADRPKERPLLRGRAQPMFGTLRATTASPSAGPAR